MMNTRKEPLLFLDISLENEYLGRVFIESVPNSTSLIDLFSRLKNNRQSSACFATVCEILSHTHVKFEWNISQQEIANCNVINNGTTASSSAPLDNADKTSNCDYVTLYSDLPSGVIVSNQDEPGSAFRFSVLTTRWTPNDHSGKVLGRVFKGMSIMAHLTSLETDTTSKPLKLCKVTDIGVIDAESNLGLKKRDALLDHYPTLPQDAVSVDFTDIDRVLTVGYTIKASGSLLFRQERYQMAMYRFSKAVRYLTYAGEKQKLTREQEIRLLSLVVPCILNSAACKIKCKDFDSALEDCNEALEINPGNPKIYFRRGQAQHGKMNYEQSLYDLYTALKLSPNDKSIKNEIAAVEGEMQVYKKRKGAKAQKPSAQQTP